MDQEVFRRPKKPSIGLAFRRWRHRGEAEPSDRDSLGAHGLDGADEALARSIQLFQAHQYSCSRSTHQHFAMFVDVSSLLSAFAVPAGNFFSTAPVVRLAPRTVCGGRR